MQRECPVLCIVSCITKQSTIKNCTVLRSTTTFPIFSAIAPSIGETITSCASAAATKNNENKTVNVIKIQFKDDGEL